MSLIKRVQASILFASYKGLKAKTNTHEGINSVATDTIAGSILQKSQEEFETKLYDSQSMT